MPIMHEDLTDGYGREALLAAFDAVRPDGNWKNPIDAVVPQDTDLDRLRSAVIFFTGSEPTFTPCPTGGWRVTAEGYYMAVGA